jgi:cytochrome oxidase Cu insertion factor (SCO1/SenC/PrrC family)
MAQASSQRSTESVASNAAVVWACVIFILLGMVFGIFYIFRVVVPDMKSEKLGVIHRIERDLEAVEKSGKTVKLSELQGKVYLMSYVYGSCSQGCAGVVEALRDLNTEFGSDPNFHIVSVSVHPTAETPEVLRNFAQAHQVDLPNWWFLTGELEPLRTFMTKQVRMEPVKDIPEAKRLGPGDLFEHDLRIVIVDQKANVRSMYQVMNADPGIKKMVMEKLRKDLRGVLKEAADEKAQSQGPK